MVLQRGHLKPQQPEVSDFRVLSRQDLALLAEKRPTQTLATLRDTHHRIARAVAAGLPNDEVAKYCGMSYNRVSMLKKDPAFMELVAHYRGVVTAEFIQQTDAFMEVATANMLKAAVMISDKLDDAIDKGEFLPTRDLLAIHDTGADRFGYGKMQKNLNVNVDFASQLEQARKRSAKAKIIDGSPSSLGSSPSLQPQIEGSSSASPRSAPMQASAPSSHASGPSTFRRV